MADATIGASVATIAPALTVIDGTITTTSLQIAQHFGKRHDLVLRAIRNLECSPEFHARNFAEMTTDVVAGKGAVRKSPAYRMTRDGFVFLAMGFTGKEAAQWKEAYIEAFNLMERELLARTTRPVDPAIDYRRIDANQAQALKEEVARIVASGAQGYGETWARLHRKFRVNSYLELPATRFQEALAYLQAKAPNAVRVRQPDLIDPEAILLTGQADPVELTPAQRAMIQHRAWELAGEACQLIHKHIERRVAFHVHQNQMTDEHIGSVVRGTTLGNALTHHYGQQLGAMASILKYMHATTHQTMERFNADMGRLAAAGVV